LALAKVDSMTETYMIVAVVSTMAMSRPLPSMTKWRYVIISGYFYTIWFRILTVFIVLPGYVIRLGHVA